MSFLRLFPNREYEQIKKLKERKAYGPLLVTDVKIIEYTSEDEKSIVSNASVFIPKEQPVDAMAGEYRQAIRKFFYLAWFLSFIPGQDAYKKRKALSNELEAIKKKFKEQLSKDQRFNFLQKLAIRTMDLSSWQKVLVVSLLTLALAAITLTGIGALAGLGVFGAAAAGYAVSQLAVTGFATIAANLGINVLILAAVTTAISGFLAAVGLRELLHPGSSFRFLGIDELPNGEPNKVREEFYVYIPYIIPFLGPLIDFIRTVIAYRNAAPPEKATKKDEMTEAGISLVKYLFNPFAWVKVSLLALTYMAHALIEKTPLPRAVRHGIKGVLSFIVEVPLTVIVLLDIAVSIPIKIVIFSVKEVVEHLAAFSKKTLDKSASFEKNSVPLTPSTNSSYDKVQPSLNTPRDDSYPHQQQQSQGNFNKYGDTHSGGVQMQNYSTKPAPVPEFKENDNSEEDYQQYSYQ